MVREILSLNIGQAGVQLSNACWELFCIEHGVRADGLQNSTLEMDQDDLGGINVFFQGLNNGTHVPRVVTIDFEPTVIDEIRLGAFRKLFHPASLISGKEDCANNFVRGSYSVGKIYLKPVMAQIRKAVEICDSLQGFCFLNAFDGGTGSGFSSSLVESLSQEFSKRTKFQLGVYPSRHYASSVVYPYNAVLHMHATLKDIDVSTLVDNQALFRVCTNKLDIKNPSFSTINRLVAQLYSSFTISMRHNNLINNDLDQFCTNIVPYPRIHFPIPHMSPILSHNNESKDSNHVGELTREVFLRDNQLVEVDTVVGRFISCCLQYRGLLSPTQVNKAVFELKRQADIRFVDWCPTGYKIGISCKPIALTPGSPMAQVNRSLTMISNSTSIVELFAQLEKKFYNLFNSRSFVHWFVGEGLEEGEFIEALNDLNALIQDYREISYEDNRPLRKASSRRSFVERKQSSERLSQIEKRPSQISRQEPRPSQMSKQERRASQVSKQEPRLSRHSVSKRNSRIDENNQNFSSSSDDINTYDNNYNYYDENLSFIEI